MEILYKATDGQTFSSQEECEAYEEKLLTKDFSEDFNRILYASRVYKNGRCTIQFFPIQSINNPHLGDVCYVPDADALRAIKLLPSFKYSYIHIGYNYRIGGGDCDEWSSNRIEELMEQKKEIDEEIETLEEKVIEIEKKLSFGLPVKKQIEREKGTIEDNIQEDF